MKENEYSLLSISQAAAKLGIGRNTLSQLISEGRIRVIQIRDRMKIPIREIELFLEEGSAYITDLPSSKKLSPIYDLKEFTSNAKKQPSVTKTKLNTDELFNKAKEEFNHGDSI